MLLNAVRLLPIASVQFEILGRVKIVASNHDNAITKISLDFVLLLPITSFEVWRLRVLADKS